jgi:hypothetical protein
VRLPRLVGPEAATAGPYQYLTDRPTPSAMATALDVLCLQMWDDKTNPGSRDLSHQVRRGAALSAT